MASPPAWVVCRGRAFFGPGGNARRLVFVGDPCDRRNRSAPGSDTVALTIGAFQPGRSSPPLSSRRCAAGLFQLVVAVGRCIASDRCSNDGATGFARWPLQPAARQRSTSSVLVSAVKASTGVSMPRSRHVRTVW